MNKQTQGIVLKQIKYSETSLIVKVYTKNFGIQSYLIKGVRNKKNRKSSAALFLPLSHINILSFTYKKSDLNIYKEGKPYLTLNSLHSNPIKINLTFFISDLLSNTLKEESENHELFDFISQSLQILDDEHTNYANFHLWFMLHLTKFLGFYPNIDSIEKSYFNLLEGSFVSSKSIHTCTEKESELIRTFLQSDITTAFHLQFNQLKRNDLLEILIKYYTLHDHNISNLKSLSIIQEVFKII